MPMMLKKTTLFLFFSFFIGTFSYAQHIAVSNNLLFDVAGAFSAGVEIPLSSMTSIEAYGSIRPWKRQDDNVHKHWLVQAQYRIWPCQVMNGFFFGPYAHFGEYNLGNQTVLFGLLEGLKPNRYEGWLAGAGIGIGYEYALAKHWNVGAEIGAGYTFIKYKKYNCEICGTEKDDDVYHYLGISRLGLSLIYVF
jgi:hypothetical protein